MILGVFFPHGKITIQKILLGNNMLKKLAIVTTTILLSGCLQDNFGFDEGSMEGFTLDGLYNGGTSTHIEECDQGVLTTGPEFWLSPDSVLAPEDPDSGSIGLRIVPYCFSDLASTGFWRFDFVSPNLEADSKWQNLDEVAFSIRSNIPGVLTQPMLKVRDAEDDVHFIVPSDGAGGPLFTEVTTGAWQRVSFDLSDTVKPYDIIEMRARVFGDIALNEIYWGPEAQVTIDQVSSYRD